MDKQSKPFLALQWLPILLLFLSTWHVTQGADPVYSPPTLSDSSGNNADSSSAVTWASLPTGDPYNSATPARVSSGLEPYYGLVHSFINTVFSKGIPKGLIEKAVEGDFSSITSNYSEYVGYLIGYAICVAIGILFLFIFPIVACCFCGCRCCGNCGGKMYQSDKDASNSCKKYAFTLILLTAVIFLVVGMVCIYVNNSNTSTALNSMSPTTKEQLSDIRLFLNNTAKEANHIARTNFNFMVQAVTRDLDNVEYLVGLPLRQDIETETNIRTTLTSAYSLTSDLESADTALTDVETKKTALETSLTALTTAIDGVKTSLDSIFTTCGANCPVGSRPAYGSAATGIDNSAFPGLTGPRTSMDNAKGSNLTAKIQDAVNELDSIPERVGNDSLTNRNDLKTTLNDLSDDIDPLVKEIDDLNSLVSGSNATIDLDQLAKTVDDFGTTIQQYDKYRSYGGIGLASIVLLVIVMVVFGMIFGVLGSSLSTPPSKRGCASNCGGVFLLWSAAFVFIFSSLLMLLTMVTFMIGAPIQRFVCVPVTELDELEELFTIYSDQQVGTGKYYIAKTLLGNDTIPLTISGLLKDCKDGKAALNAFKLDSKFNLNDILNYSKTLDVQAEIDGITVDFSSVDIYPSSLSTQLNDLKAAVNISFQDFYDEMNKSPTTTNLTALADEIDAYANGLSGALATTAADIRAEANKLRAIETTEKADVVTKTADLNSSVAAMDAAVSGIPASVNALQTGLSKADTYIATNASSAVKSLLNTYVTRILSIVDSYVDYTSKAANNQMGTCEPVWNMYNTLMVYTLCYNIMDTLNGFWFSLGWCIFFFMFSLIFSIKLAKYFRRMQEDDSDGSFVGNGNTSNEYGKNNRFSGGDPIVESTPSKPQLWMRKNRVQHHDDCPTPENDAYQAGEPQIDNIDKIPDQCVLHGYAGDEQDSNGSSYTCPQANVEAPTEDNNQGEDNNHEETISDREESVAEAETQDTDNGNISPYQIDVLPVDDSEAITNVDPPNDEVTVGSERDGDIGSNDILMNSEVTDEQSSIHHESDA